MLAGDLGVTANGNISPCRFIKGDTSGDGLVVQAGAGDPCIGVSQEGTHTAPYGALSDGFAAVAGEPVKGFKLGEFCLLETGAAVTRWDRLKSDVNGKGITAAAADSGYAIAYQTASGAGKKIPVMVIYDTPGAA